MATAVSSCQACGHDRRRCPERHARPGAPDLADYVAGWRERARREREAAAAWRARILARMPAVARMLREDFGATRVVLFGSLTRGEAKPGSDVDLLVDGLAMANLIQATVRAERLLDEAHAIMLWRALRGADQAA